MELQPEDRSRELSRILLAPNHDWLISDMGTFHPKTDLLNRQSPSHVLSRLWLLKLNKELQTSLDIAYPISWLLRSHEQPEEAAQSLLKQLPDWLSDDNFEAEDLFANFDFDMLPEHQIDFSKVDLAKLNNDFLHQTLIWISYGKFHEEWKKLFFKRNPEGEITEESEFGDHDDRFKTAWSIQILYDFEKFCLHEHNNESEFKLLQIGGGHALFLLNSNDEDNSNVKKDENFEYSKQLAENIQNQFLDAYGWAYRINYSTSAAGIDADHLPNLDTKNFENENLDQIIEKFGLIDQNVKDGLEGYKERWTLLRERPMTNNRQGFSFYLDGINISRYWKIETYREAENLQHIANLHPTALPSLNAAVSFNFMSSAFRSSLYLTSLMETTIGGIVAQHVVKIDAMGGDEIIGSVSSCTKNRDLERYIVDRTNQFIDDFGLIDSKDRMVQPAWWLGCIHPDQIPSRFQTTTMTPKEWSDAKNKLKESIPNSFRKYTMYPVLKIY